MMQIEMIARQTSLALIAIALAATLAGSGTASSQDASRFVVAPDKYVLYGCPQLAVARAESLKRLRELEALMAKASAGGAGGQFMGNLAYGSELLSVKGDLREQERTAREKNCNPQPGRPASHQSDVIIR
jgi:hypothetical protein